MPSYPPEARWRRSGRGRVARITGSRATTEAPTGRWTRNLSRTLRSLRAGLLLAAVVVASARAQAALPFNLIQLGGYAMDLSDDGAVVVGGVSVSGGTLGFNSEPVRWARQSDGTYAMEFLDAARRLRTQAISVAVSADGSVVVFLGRDLAATVGASLYRWGAGQLELLAAVTFPETIQWPQISGDGERIFFVSGRAGTALHSLEMIDRVGARSVIDGNLGNYSFPWDSSQDGRVISVDGTLWIESAAGWRHEIVQPGASDGELPLSSNGEWVTVNDHDPNYPYSVRGYLWNRVTQRRYDLGSGEILDFTDDRSTAVIDYGLWSRGTGPLGVSVGSSGRTSLTPDGRYFLTVGAIGELAPRCGNGIDDDGDGRTDAKDPGCTSPSDTSEKEASFACDDAVDQDLDGAIDFPFDPGCASPRAQLESPQCNDGLDNDSDGRIDVLEADCPAAWGNTESPHAPAGGCGIGPELALALPLLAWLRRRRGSSGESQEARGIPSNSTREELDDVLAD